MSANPSTDKPVGPELMEALADHKGVAGDLLSELGYERAVPDPSPAALEHAARMRELFVSDVAGRRFPKNGRP